MNTYTIKPLEWKANDPATLRYILFFAETIIGHYVIGKSGPEFYVEWFDGKSVCASVDAGKAIAEAHYLSRLLPALAPVTKEKQ